ncbi:MAG: hypothetical protein EOO68_10010, partial [Moraxellaceae bacterium]
MASVMDGDSELNNSGVDDLKSRLIAISQRDKHQLIFFAARCTLRALPLLALDNAFSYWGSNPDQKAINILAIFYGGLSGLLESKNKSKKVLRSISEAHSSITTSPNISTQTSTAPTNISLNDYPIIFGVAASAEHTLKAANSDSPEEIVTESFNAFSQSTYINTLKESAIKDLNSVEDGYAIKQSPLWNPENLVEARLKLNIDWRDAIESITQQSKESSPETGALLEAMFVLHRIIYDGDFDINELENFYDSLTAYFNKNTKSDTHTTNDAHTFQSTPTLTYIANRQQFAESISFQDSLNRQKLVNTLAEFLAHPKNNHHLTIGLLGDWGVGKSSVVQLLKRRILESHAEQPFLFAEFNAWAYEHTNNLQAGIAQ